MPELFLDNPAVPIWSLRLPRVETACAYQSSSGFVNLEAIIASGEGARVEVQWDPCARESWQFRDRVHATIISTFDVGPRPTTWQVTVGINGVRWLTLESGSDESLPF